MQQTLLDVARTTKPSSTGAAPLNHSYTLFQEPWWLDAVAPDQWDEVVVKRGTEVAARLPFLRRTKFGSTWLLQPKLTPYLGPWLRPTLAKLSNCLAEQKELMTELIDALPRFDLFRQCFSPDITYWLPFYWRGFYQTTRYTYRLSNLTDLATIWAGFRPNIRLEIRKAERSLTIRDDLDLDYFLRVWQRTFERQHSKLPVSKEQCYRIENACAKRGCRRIIFAEDIQGKVHAATYLVWNNKCTYYLMAGGDPELRTSGAGSLLMWEAIKFAATMSEHFDFEGSMIEPVERFFRAFGGTPTPYFSIQKLSPGMQVFNGLYHSTSALIGHNPRL
jgi:lipid II:glycine glycyltransferase (peptidoglycan interpeptide bridge formation enzyme)